MTQKIIVIFILLLVKQAFAELSQHEKELVRNMASYVMVPEKVMDSFEKLSSQEFIKPSEPIHVEENHSNILFKYYPELQKKLSYIALGDLPTPVYFCKNLSATFSHAKIFIKHDGTTGKITADGTRTFGGNKLRKLQYLLADAIAHGHHTVLTFGCVGSNHALQTTVCAQELGLKTICMLRHQPNSHVVQRNLLLQKAHNAQVYFSPDTVVHGLMTAAVCYDQKQRTGQFPYVIPVGGSCARGAVGYVEAAFELKEQIESNILPVPDRMYVTLGSAGTASGLLLGLKAAGITTKVYLVIEAPETVPGTALKKVYRLFAETNALLQSYDSTFPTCSLHEHDYEVITDCAGRGYGLFTQEAVDAINILYTHEKIKLDGTYTGKCFSALIRDVQSGSCNGQTILFWNTFCGEDFNDIIATVDYHQLPHALHRYFEEPVQTLDR